MRIYLDTNILAFMLTDRLDDISQDTMLQLNDYTNQLMASSVCVAELIHLCQIGKLSGGRRKGAPPRIYHGVAKSCRHFHEVTR